MSKRVVSGRTASSVDGLETAVAGMMGIPPASRSVPFDLASKVFAAPTPAVAETMEEKAKGIDVTIVDMGDHYAFKIPKTIPLDNVNPCKPQNGKPSNYVYTVLRAPAVTIELTGTNPTDNKPASARFNTKPFTFNLMLKVS